MRARAIGAGGGREQRRGAAAAHKRRRRRKRKKRARAPGGWLTPAGGRLSAPSFPSACTTAPAAPEAAETVGPAMKSGPPWLPSAPLREESETIPAGGFYNGDK
jgi:hypothetical protein